MGKNVLILVLMDNQNTLMIEAENKTYMKS